MNVSLLLALGVAVALGLIWMFCHHRRSPAGPYSIKNAKVCPKCSARQDGKAKRCGVCGCWF